MEIETSVLVTIEGEATREELDLYMAWLVIDLPQLREGRQVIMQEISDLEDQLEENENHMASLMKPTI